ncbi:hypothetical protein ARGLB_033_00110 [Arthrobacter globiformis NBRC 12137]|uniref:Biotin synthase auxiliary protein n=1 Tax=Arthrobacter globiformis (strain ATCC 8010 / DSM 20124 / JCM 1332 / NBRC 12137 / NCIMB 8907 / NRRL B-2979 / 168) TaxID=1077972 RepID=H0QJN4_ARTG1|nr:hypothetical protein ARGLB_033_00110 [Arthrobacter globiformis NBRC 12137]
MIPNRSLTSQVPTGSQPSQAQAGALAGVGPRPGNPAVVAPVPTGNAGASASSTSGTFCGHCGGQYDGGDGPPSYAHRTCGERLAMEPPRYCTACRRRMKVQVTPLGWSAECSRHGVLVP